MKPSDEFAVIVAGIVQAGTFQLVNSGGSIVAELAPATVRIGVSDVTGAQLQLRHLDATIPTDSSLKWSQNPAVGSEAVELSGPTSGARAANLQLVREPTYQQARLSPGTGPLLVLSDEAGAAGGFSLSDSGAAARLYITSRGGGTLPQGGFIGDVSASALGSYAGLSIAGQSAARLEQGVFDGPVFIAEWRARCEVNDRWTYCSTKLTAGGTVYQLRLGELYGYSGVFSSNGNSLALVGNPTVRIGGGGADPTNGLVVDASNVVTIGPVGSTVTRLTTYGKTTAIIPVSGGGPFGFGQAQLEAQSGAATPSHAAVALHLPGVSAFQLRSYSSFGRIDAVDTGGSAYVPLGASAFTVVSSARFKRDLAELPDGTLLAAVGRLTGRRWRPATTALPHGYTPSERLRRINRLRERRRQRPITPSEAPAEVDYVPAGLGSEMTPERVGLVLEEVADVFPELVHVDEAGAPEMMDIGQVAPLALAGVAALVRELDELRRRVAELESKN